MNEDIKDRIVKTASPLFLFNGIKSVTMDAIAHKTGISKRTLYENFRDKDELLVACIAYNHRKSEREIQQIVQGCTNSVEILLRVSRYIIEKHHFINPNYFTDMKRYHALALSCFDEHQSHQDENTITLLQNGIQEGVFRPDINVEVHNLLLRAQIRYITQSLEVLSAKYQFGDLMEALVDGFVRGVASRKGLDVIEAYMQREGKHS